AEQNIAKLFQAALLPGLLAALFYCITIGILVRRNPDLVPPQPPPMEAPEIISHWRQRLVALIITFTCAVLWYLGYVGVGFSVFVTILSMIVAFASFTLVPVISIAVIVLGGIYGGIFTPTEGAAVGAVAMLLTGLAQRQLGRKDISAAL